ncbi:MAG: hypothetical protein KGQ59_04890 [Bdellovibrionales bacterium]|nr:hypothetical protein [Bdellovibrionales bacterium]
MAQLAAQLRSEIQSVRKELTESERNQIQATLDLQALRFIQNYLNLEAGMLVGLHRPLPWEWSIPQGVSYFKKLGVLLAYPRMRDPEDRLKGMCWHLADEANPAQWRPSARVKTLLEPQENMPEIDPARFHSVWVPGVAFSRRGERMGTGGGFYDLFLSHYPRILKWAVAARFQVLDSLPEQRPDEPRMNYLVSEAETLSFVGREVEKA